MFLWRTLFFIIDDLLLLNFGEDDINTSLSERIGEDGQWTKFIVELDQ